MHNIIAICPSVSLDLQLRLLIRTTDGKKVILPASACLCLQALVDVKGDILSQEQLMEIGWRSQGVEVTENSVRVMINKLRRAIDELALQDVLTLLAVTRSGYRLIVRNAQPLVQATPLSNEGSPSPDLESLINHDAKPLPAPSAPSLLQRGSPLRRWRGGLLATAAGMLVGGAVGIMMQHFYLPKPINVEFVRWSGANIPAQTEVWVEKNKQFQSTHIEATLQTYLRYLAETRPNDKPSPVLYITQGAASMTQFHQGLLACQQPLKENKNECEAFYFHLN